MTIRLGMVTIDCARPRELAEFWRQALDIEIAGDYGDFVMLASAEEAGVRLALQRVPEPREGKNRVHLDLETGDRDVEVARLTELGATPLSEHAMDGFGWTVLADPEGNEFCVGSPHG
ncbi:VOC family protein [Prauserella cavernicola]|uniref:VOC family protein n=1 Tax=Prauserella cavernicola TaxID=2800127 RepID=A0A934V6H5_9PSEU|nr:VOC family protein [Prauserella cavernicola]MBK1786714.1 VOC family protein [Prauserella cavernicola]